MKEEKLLKALDLAIYKLSEMLMTGVFDPEHEENFERNIERIKAMRAQAIGEQSLGEVETTTLKDKLIAKLKSGTPYTLHNCSLCGYPCNFNSDGRDLFYDSGCDCGSFGDTNRWNSWDKLDFYLDPSNGHIANIEKFVDAPNPTEE